MGADLSPARSLGRTKNGTHEPAIAIEHHDRLQAVFVVMGVEQAQLLAAMHGIKGNISRLPITRTFPPRQRSCGRATPLKGGLWP